LVKTMMIKNKPVDKIFLGIVLILLFLGIISFFSASLGVVARNETKFYGIILNQLLFGLVGGGISLYLFSKIKYTFWKKYAFYIFLFSLILMIGVFIPGLSLEHGGAKRWIDLGFISFQPAEFLKIAFIIYLAAWLSWMRKKVEDFRFGVLPLLIMLGIVAVLLFLQPDTKSFVLMFIAGGAMLFASGVPIRYVVIISGITIGVLVVLTLTTPYIKDRFVTFLDPSSDPKGSSYQLQQSQIALGSGGMFGRGLGQSIQKFGYLPEPQGDSIFAVIGEESGFVGSTVILILYIGFMLRGMRIANRAQDQFGRLLVIGIVILITAQSFMNIASIVGVLPLTGVPLVFMSQGGTSLLISLISVGIVLSVSRFANKKETS
jgi:cell division protein FtsW